MLEFIACLLIGRLKNPFEGVFDEGWEFDEYHAWNIDKGYSIWIANGYIYIEDKDIMGRCKPHNMFVTGATLVEKYLIWKALERTGRKRFKRLHNL